LGDHSQSFTALVLAGRRGASDEFADALTAADAAPHHALLDVGGEPMLLRVVRVLRDCREIGRIVVCIDEPSALDAVPELAQWLADGSLECRTALDSPSRSVSDLLRNVAPGERALVVAADHALLTPEMVSHITRADSEGADMLVAVVTSDVIRARYPDTKRTWLKFRDVWISGANLFAFLTPEAERAAEFWVRAERFRKQPWKLVSAFGPGALFAFLFRRLDLDDAFVRVSRTVGARVRAVRMPWAEAAIDVDRPADLVLVNRILAEREGESPRE
jgi:2-phospho-L-lactate guanylyltransferase (CobY/MobA/RfbA family)